MDANFITTSPDVLVFYLKMLKIILFQIQSDLSFETLNNYKYECTNDVFFALSHGVHRGSLKSEKLMIEKYL